MPSSPEPPFAWPLAVHRVDLGPERYDLLGLRDFEETVSALAAHVGAGGDPRWFEDWCPMFGVIWPSARALAAEVQRRAPWTGRTSLELGCGLALPSIAAARCGARASATDQHPHTPDFLAENLARNGVHVAFAAFDWDRPPPDLGRADLVLASDVLYTRDQPAPVARAFARYLAPGGVGLLADPGRPWLDAFAVEARALGLHVDVDVVGDDIFLLELTGR